MTSSAAEELDLLVERVDASCLAVSVGDRCVRHVRALHVPGDELCLYLFEASSLELVAEAVRLAGLRPIRLVEAVPALASPTAAAPDGSCDL